MFLSHSSDTDLAVIFATAGRPSFIGRASTLFIGGTLEVSGLVAGAQAWA